MFQDMKWAKDSLDEIAGSTVSAVTAATNQAVSAVSATTEKAKGTLNETARSAVNSIAETAHLAQDSLNQTAGEAIQTISDATASSVSTVTETASQAKASLENSIQLADSLNQAAASAIQNAVGAAIQNWLDSHPVISWSISHPVLSLVILILAIFIISGFFRAVGSLFEKAWLLILRSPLEFGRVLLNVAVKKRTPAKQPKYYPSATLDNSSEHLTKILTRLEEIGQEQNYLLREVSAILESEK